jgi:hypothetical protein
MGSREQPALRAEGQIGGFVRADRESLSQWESRPCARRLDERLFDWSTTVNALTG